MIKYQARIRKSGDGYSVDFPDLPGCFSQGMSWDEAVENAREALSLMLEEARNPKWNIPKPSVHKGRAYVWITPHLDIAIPLIIRQTRLQAGLTQKELAKRLGVSFQQVQKLETPGKSNPTIQTLEDLADAFSKELEVEFHRRRA